MRFISLFAGIGGFDLGLEWAGWQCVAQVEIDDWRRSKLDKLWPDVPKWGDIRDVKGTDLPSADAIVGGFPCQPHSVAGKQKGAADDRDLWPEYRRLIAEIHPAWVVGENVPGLEHTELDTVLSDLECEGYEVVTLNIPAIALDAPHRRERLWIIARRPGRMAFPHDLRPQELRCRGYAHNGERDRSPSQRQRHDVTNGAGANGSNVPHPNGNGPQGIGRAGATARPVVGSGSRWAVEPRVGRVAHGVPRRVDRIKGLGNAVVPQVAEFVGRMILQYEGERVVPAAERPQP